MNWLLVRLGPGSLLLLACLAGANGAAPESWQSYGADVVRTTSADPAWQITFHGGLDWPNVRMPIATPANSLPTTALVPVENLSQSVIDLLIRIGDDAGATWPDHAIATHVLLEPRERTTLIVTLANHDARAFGMRGAPLPESLSPEFESAPHRTLVEESGRVDASHLQSLYWVIWGQTGSRSILIGAPRYVEADWDRSNYVALVDRFGQRRSAHWPETIHTAGELDLRTSAATANSAGSEFQSPSSPTRDVYGGNLGATHWPASGFFRTEHDADGRAYLVTPLGNPFYSIGVNAVSIGEGATIFEGREFMFAELPALPNAAGTEMPEDSFFHQVDVGATREGIGAHAYDHGWAFNFYAANLGSRYGPDFHARWAKATSARLSAWGFNTVGNWSDAQLIARHELAYTLPISVDGDFGRIPGKDGLWGALPDPFDPRFARAVTRAVSAAVVGHVDDPWLVGYFVDNELAWGVADSVARSTLTLPGSTPAKVELLAALHAKYVDISALVQAWHATPFTWSDLETGRVTLPVPASDGAKRDLADFGVRLADRYFRIVRDALKAADPNHLYLGSRFAAATDEAVSACDRWCDVITVNLYTGAPVEALAGVFSKRAKPILVSEFNFSSTDRDPPWAGIVPVASEGERGRAYADFVEQLARLPNVVGVHWFEYLDEPVTGRVLDGENAHFGLVNVTDQAYQGFVRTVTAANIRAQSSRLGTP